jgi:hypothetical protein
VVDLQVQQGHFIDDFIQAPWRERGIKPHAPAKAGDYKGDLHRRPGASEG